MMALKGEESKEAAVLQPKMLRSASGDIAKVPEYIYAYEDYKKAFEPAPGARPLPDAVKEMLLKAFGITFGPGSPADECAPADQTRPKPVEILCHVDRLYVRIRRDVFNSRGAFKHLRVGTCPVNEGSNEFYYFLYLLTDDCGFQKELKENDWYVSVVLHYDPPGPVLREISFQIPLQCKYPRFFHSFKVGFYPSLQGGTILKALRPKVTFTLNSQNALGNRITVFFLGQRIFFEARQTDSTAGPTDVRLYINKSFITASPDPNSSPKYVVIDNYGCMYDGMETEQSEFLPSYSKAVQRFSVGSLIFKDLTSSPSAPQKLYMHSDVSMGSTVPTPTSKACNYDATNKKRVYSG
ncbi:uncharacterized protein V6R79_017884 [Siganus canaliculatus]